MQRDPAFFVIQLIVIFLGLGVHEYAHAKFADMAGDPTPRLQGRVTLNIFKHLDPVGTIMIIVSSWTGFGIGWGKPVMVNPSRMRNPRWDHFISVIAGPLSNLLQAVIYTLLLKIFMMSASGGVDVLGFLDPSSATNLVGAFLVFGVLLNLSLCIFNLIPIGPLDGHWLVGAFLPYEAQRAWYAFNRGPGSILFLALVLIPVSNGRSILSEYYFPIVLKVFSFLVGVH